MTHLDFTKDKNKKELVSGLVDHGTGAAEQIKMGIIALCTEEIKEAIQSAVESNNKLSKRILWLNIILGAFTVIGTVLAVIQMFKGGQ